MGQNLEIQDQAPGDFVLLQDLEIPLLNIHNRLKRNEKIQKQILDIQVKNQQVLNSIEIARLRTEKVQQQILDSQLQNQQILSSIEMAQLRTEKVQQQILDSQIKNQQILGSIEEIQLHNEKTLIGILKLEQYKTDEGKNIVKNNLIIKPNVFTVIETLRDPGHPVKATFIKNNGPNSVFVAYNSSIEGINPAIEDVKSDNSRFIELKNGEEKKWNFNIRAIHDVQMILDPDIIKTNPKAVSTCRVELAW